MTTNHHSDLSEYDHIELTDEEVVQAIRYKKMLKSIALEGDEKKQQELNRVKSSQQPVDYTTLRKMILDDAKNLPFEFIIDEDNERVFNLLCLYFSGDPAFNNEFFEYSDGRKMQLSLKKGIALMSSKKGTGKTILMRLFQRNKFRPYLQIETKNIAAAFLKNGEKAIEIHSEPLKIVPHPNMFYFGYVGLCYDDLGFEIPKNYWGSKSDVMADVLFSIYRKYQMSGDFSNFHITTNLSGKDIEARYDDRIRDRMREMFNFITLKGDSRRK